MKNTAYIIVDVQNDFAEGGSLGTAGGLAAGEKIARFVEKEASVSLKVLIATRDWHINPGAHFDTWPIHCVAQTEGAEFTPAIQKLLSSHSNVVISKGLYSDGYSGFQGTNLETQHLLDTTLWDRSITDIVIGGIATDHCVRATALDGLLAGFGVTVITDHCAGVAEDTTAAALAELAAAGVVLVTEEEYLKGEER